VRIVRSVGEMRDARDAQAEPVGFVPTMGYLHQGHISLVRRARLENKSVVVSIFVNPAQFGPHEDLARYPRDEARDLALLASIGTDIAFLPSTEEIYPPGFDTWIDVKGVSERLEGAARPGHFCGVATVCNKLFNLVLPRRAYFGQKDAQQVLVVQKMVAELNMDLEVVVLPTVREADGLAMSSRNSYLNPAERQAAPVLYRALQMTRALFTSGETDARVLRECMRQMIMSEPSTEIDYLSIAHPFTLEEMAVLKPPVLVSLAVRIGKTRLIDNLVL
jgi:pantoate--beta-alanine ligase